MKILKHQRRRKTGVWPNRIFYEKDVTWTKKTKPDISLDGITQEDYQILDSRMKEMLALADKILFQYYMDPKSDDFVAEAGSFPDIRYMTGNYYIGHVYYGCFYNCVSKDKSRTFRCSPHEIKDGKALCKSSETNKEAVKEWIPLKDLKITRYYHIILGLILTGDEDGREGDYMELDLDTKFDTLDAPMEFEILESKKI